MNYLKACQHYLGSQKTNVFTDNVSLRYFETQPRANAKQLQWHDTLALVNIELIHKNGKDNVVSNALSHKNEYQREMPWEVIKLSKLCLF
jgi:hypothetical protein